jgi:hypothetical protein
MGYHMGLPRSVLNLGVVACAPELGVIPHPCTDREPPVAGVETAGSLKGYLTRVKPLLRTRCYACHGGVKQEAGLRVDTVDLVLRGGESGPAVVKGEANERLILERAPSSDPAERMPPLPTGRSAHTPAATGSMSPST